MGGEAGLDVQVTRWLTGFVNYAYQDVIWKEDNPYTLQENEKGKRIKEAPIHKLNGNLRFKFGGGFSANLLGHYVGETGRSKDQTFVKVDRYTLFNARVGYRFLNDRAEVTVAVFNLFNDGHREYPQGDRIGRRVAANLSIRL